MTQNNLQVDQALRQVVDSMLRKSPSFAAMVSRLNAADGKYILRLGKLPVKNPGLTVVNYGSGAVTIIDTQQLKNLHYQTAQGQKSLMTLERVIAHELSHGQYHEILPFPFDRISPHSFIIRSENKIMREIFPASPDRNEKNDVLYTS